MQVLLIEMITIRLRCVQEASIRVSVGEAMRSGMEV